MRRTVVEPKRAVQSLLCNTHGCSILAVTASKYQLPGSTYLSSRTECPYTLRLSSHQQDMNVWACLHHKPSGSRLQTASVSLHFEDLTVGPHLLFCVIASVACNLVYAIFVS